MRSGGASGSRFIAPVEGHGGVTLSNVCPHCRRYLLEHCEVNKKKTQCNWWCSARGGKCDWRNPT